MSTVFTIGYEGAAIGDFIHTLVREGVEQLVDIRELPQSRRPGFSKNILAAALEKAGISYRHVKQLGDPKHGREAARRGAMDEFRAIFSAHMDLPSSAAALKELEKEVRSKPTVLLCYERNPKCCHRTIVVERLLGLHPFKVRHLGVQHGSGAGRDAAAVGAVQLT